MMKGMKEISVLFFAMRVAESRPLSLSDLCSLSWSILFCHSLSSVGMRVRVTGWVYMCEFSVVCPVPGYSITGALLSWLQIVVFYSFPPFWEFMSQIIDSIVYISFPLPLFKKGKAVYLSQEILWFRWESSGSLQSPERKIQERK